MPVPYVCISIPALEIGLSEPLFQIPHIYINMQYIYIYIFFFLIYFVQGSCWVWKLQQHLQFLLMALVQMDSLWGAGVTFWVLLQNCHIQPGHPRSKCHVKGSLQATCEKTLVELGACYRFLNWNQFEYNLNTNAIWIAFEYKTAVSVLMTRGKNWDWKQLSSAPWRGQSQRVPSGLSLWPSQQEKVGEKTPFFPFSHCISKTP